MNWKIKATITTLCGLLVAITLIAQSGGDTSKVQQLEQEMRQAQKNNDASWYQQHLADGYVEGHSWGEWATKDEALKQMQNKAIKFTQGEISDITVSTFGSDVAVAHYKFT